MYKKLLRQNINKTQLIGFSLANLVGLTIVFLSFQLYIDTKPLLGESDTILKKDYFVITKQISAVGAIRNSSFAFSEAEISDIKSQKFVKNLGEFLSSDFSVYGSINAAGMSIGTDLFFEAIPNQFIDIQPEKWKYDLDSGFIPIIIPQNYIDLYNFGFAKSQDMPNISDGMIQMVSIDILISGNGRSRIFKGGIVGFSNRINTILAPREFILWANSEFSTQKQDNPSRLILEINNITDPGIAPYFKAKSYKIEGENQAVGKMAYFLKIAFVAMLGVGILISILSIIILCLSIFLIIQKNREKIKNLRLIGYSKVMLSSFYIKFAVIINFVVSVAAVAIVLLVRPIYISTMSKAFGVVQTSSTSITIVLGLLTFVAISVFNALVIFKKINKI